MAPRFSPRRYSPTRWLRRIDRAAAAINPFLFVLMIGLAALNLTCLVLLSPGLPLSRHPNGLPGCQPATDEQAAVRSAVEYSALMPD
jgi:hypothetical protein